jgi:hypothetical protein
MNFNVSGSKSEISFGFRIETSLHEYFTRASLMTR